MYEIFQLKLNFGFFLSFYVIFLLLSHIYCCMTDMFSLRYVSEQKFFLVVGRFVVLFLCLSLIPLCKAHSLPVPSRGLWYLST